MRLKYFFIALLISFPFWWGINALSEKDGNLEFLPAFSKKSAIFPLWEKFYLRGLSAQVSQPILGAEMPKEIPEPTRKSDIGEIEIGAKSAISVWVDNSGQKKVLFEKDSNQKLPIASLTKLMAAFIVLEYYDSSQIVKIPKEAVGRDEDLEKFRAGESFKTEDLLYSLLIESSNGAVIALADLVGKDAFVELMNLETKSILGAEKSNTFFANYTGLDPKNPEEQSNYSTVEDLADLAIYLLKEKPIIWAILSYPDFDLYSSEGFFHHKILSTNELLGKIPEIIGGKTGETKQAEGCLVVLLESPNQRGFLINVILGSPDRFGEMEKLVDWLNSAYKW